MLFPGRSEGVLGGLGCVLFPECLFPERSEGVLGREAVRKIPFGKFGCCSESVHGD